MKKHVQNKTLVPNQQAYVVPEVCLICRKKQKWQQESHGVWKPEPLVQVLLFRLYDFRYVLCIPKTFSCVQMRVCERLYPCVCLCLCVRVSELYIKLCVL